MPQKKARVASSAPTPPKDLSDAMFYGMRLDEEQKDFANAIWNSDIDIVFACAKAGTGKTTVSIGVANMLVQYGLYKQIVYIMSPYGERKQGWFPGTITEKSSVYFEPCYQALSKFGVNLTTAINESGLLGQEQQHGYITCITDTYLRGGNLDNAVVIIDEAQNFTVQQLKKTLTRVGKNTKVIVIGHDKQCDLDNKSQSGFLKYLEHFKDKERVAVCELVNNHRGWVSQWADELEE